MYTGISLRGVCNVQYSEMAGTSTLPTSSPGKVVEGWRGYHVGVTMSNVVEGWREARSAYLASEVPCVDHHSGVASGENLHEGRRSFRKLLGALCAASGRKRSNLVF